jgi:hypothetical protein
MKAFGSGRPYGQSDGRTRVIDYSNRRIEDGSCAETTRVWRCHEGRPANAAANHIPQRGRAFGSPLLASKNFLPGGSAGSRMRAGSDGDGCCGVQSVWGKTHSGRAPSCDVCGAPITQPAEAGEYKQVAVLVADVVRPMDIATSLEPERFREIMTAAFERSAGAAQQLGVGLNSGQVAAGEIDSEPESHTAFDLLNTSSC